MQGIYPSSGAALPHAKVAVRLVTSLLFFVFIVPMPKQEVSLLLMLFIALRITATSQLRTYYNVGIAMEVSSNNGIIQSVNMSYHES